MKMMLERKEKKKNVWWELAKFANFINSICSLSVNGDPWSVLRKSYRMIYPCSDLLSHLQPISIKKVIIVQWNWCMMIGNSLTSLAICWRISIIWEKLGLWFGSCCQQVSSSSASFGWVCLGIVGRRPYRNVG
jgi:hypothetical protein